MAKAPPKQVKGQGKAKSRSWISITVSIIAGILFYALGIAAGLLFHHFTAPEYPGPLTMVIYTYPAEPKPAAEPPQPLHLTSYYEFEEPLTTNLLNSPKLVQAKVVLSTTYDGSVLDDVRTHKLAIRGALLVVLSAATEADLRSEDGKRKLMIKIRDAANEVLRSKGRFPGIEDAHLVSFAVQ